MFPYRMPQTTSSVECSLKEAHPLAKLEEIQHTALLLFAGYLDAATSMRLQAVAVVLIQVAGDVMKTKMNPNGHVVVREWQTKCASAGKGFTDNFSTHIKRHEKEKTRMTLSD